MFFNLTSKRFFWLSSLILGLAGGIFVFLAVENETKFLEKANGWILRMEGQIVYSMYYGNFGENLAATVSSKVFYKNALATDRAQAIPVLLYHGTPPEGNSNPPLPQNVFVEQMKALKEDGWQTVTMDQFRAFMKSGSELPPKSFLLTFDDGRKESFYPVDPVLKDMGYHAVMFVITGSSFPAQGKNTTYYLSKTELEYMVNSGRWDLESHGAEDHRLYDIPAATSTDGVLPTIHDEHFLSNKFWLTSQTRVETDDEFSARVSDDLITAKSLLEKDFGKPVIAFAYPFNDYGQDSVNFPGSVDILAGIVPNIYEFAFYQVEPKREDPFNYPDQTDYKIKRIEPLASWTGQDLVKLLDSSETKYLPYEKSDFASDWNSNWGKVDPTANGLRLEATENTTGAAALLNGSEEWRNYSIDATVDWKNGSNISLISRYQSDSKTFLSCAFSKDHIVLEGHINGVQTTISSETYQFLEKDGAGLLSMSVKGRTASCSASGTILRAVTPEAFDHSGAAGIQIWDPAFNMAQADLTNVSIKPL